MEIMVQSYKIRVKLNYITKINLSIYNLEDNQFINVYDIKIDNFI